MSSTCFKPVPFSELIDYKIVKPEDRISNFKYYSAHTPPDDKNENREKETIGEHMEKVKQAFSGLVRIHGLDQIVDNHIEKLISHNDIKDKQKFYEFLKLLFFEAIYLHDIGKLNENFQIEKMGQSRLFEKQDNSIGSSHSILSVYLFTAFMIEELDQLQTDEEKGFAFVFILLFSMPIRKHHSSQLTSPFYYFEQSQGEDKNHFLQHIDIASLKQYLVQIGIEFNPIYHHDIFYGLNLDEYYKKPFISIFLEQVNSFALYSLLKLNSSLLTISDYVASSDYMWNQRIEMEGVINDELRDHVFQSFYSTHKYNQKLKGFENPKAVDVLKKRSQDNLNNLRCNMALEVRQNLFKNIDKNLFFLEAPTGGGKTNMSFMAMAELLKKRTELNKIFYVFPFTTLVTQTRESIVETFALKPEQFIELHSKAGFKQKEDKDSQYGAEKKNFIDYQFVNYPFILLSHIKFFDIIKSHRKADNYLYHKLANSVVVIDELQAYSPEHWDKIYYILKNIAELFNTVFIVMSATLPEIDQLNINGEFNVFNGFKHLIQNKQKYFQNSNFAERVEFDLSMLEKGSKSTLEEIKNKVLQESNKYAGQTGGRCWTLVEFIFKNSAAEFYDEIMSDDDFSEYEKKMLSGTILEPVRKNIINELKTKKNDPSKIILVSTQVVEAGVNLDFDLGFKDTSILDSDEQLAGRINRNASKSGCKVFLFDYNDEYHVYGSDYRYRMQKQALDLGKYKQILETKNFNDFYNPTFKYVNQLNKSESRYGFLDYESLVRRLNFPGVHNDFKLIDQETLSVFVNVEYDLKIYPIENTLGLEKDGVLKGKDVFEKYCNIVENKDQDFIAKRISLTEITGLMSNFIFSTYKSTKTIAKLRSFAENSREKYGFWYIHDVNASETPVFTLEGGLNEKAMEDTQFI